MTYQAIVEIATSITLHDRIVAAAAAEGIENPPSWVDANIWKIAASPGWADGWAYAVDTATPNVNPNTGARTDVIDDAKILAAVQTIKAAETPPE